jgi:protein-L-isoaspartate(D-aspartate) O-methyltransferase
MFEVQRKKMLQKYVIEIGIKDSKIIKAMGHIPRHYFVDNALTHQAYNGSSLPIGFGQTISHPTTVAIMTNALDLTGNEKVLEIGTGSGYQAAVLAEIGVKVYTIERIPELAIRAQRIFEKIGYYSIAVKVGDGYSGWTQYTPFQRIILTAHSTQVPPSLLKQLDINGILIMPLGNDANQKLVKIYKKSESEFDKEILKDANFVPLIKSH